MKIENFKEIIGICGYIMEAGGVLVIASGFIAAVFIFFKSSRRLTIDTAYTEFRRNLGRSILLGLEFLIAGDIIRTVVISATLQNIAVLALIIMIRTFLSITLHLEVEGRWPWQESSESLPKIK